MRISRVFALFQIIIIVYMIYKELTTSYTYKQSIEIVIPVVLFRNWAKLHDFFKHSGITSFKTAEVMRKALLMKQVLNSVTSEQPDNLRAGLSSTGKVNNWNKF